MTDQPESRKVEHHATTASLPQLPKGNKWVLNDELGEWEIVMTPDHPQWHDHDPEPMQPWLTSDIDYPLLKNVKARKTVKLTSPDGAVTVTVKLTDENRVTFGEAQHFVLAFLPRQPVEARPVEDHTP